MYPPVGNQPRSTASYWIISSASQNDGAATPTSDTSRITWSGQRSRKIAAVTPKTSGQHDRDDQAEEGQLEGQRQRGGDRLRHRRLGEHARAHVAADQVADEAHVPHGQRVEQAVLHLELVDLRRRSGWRPGSTRTPACCPRTA